MDKLKKGWFDGGSLIATYNGSGNGSAVFTSDTNEGLDREMIVKFIGGTTSVERTVRQSGMRERFIASDGAFILADDGTFNVLKKEI